MTAPFGGVKNVRDEFSCSTGLPDTLPDLCHVVRPAL